MGKSLIIKGADFSEVAIDDVIIVSSSQLSLGENMYYNNSGSQVEVTGIEGVQKIEIPEGVTLIKPISSTSGLEPRVINCFDDQEQIGLVGGDAVGGYYPLGTTGYYELLPGTKYISYIYKSSYRPEYSYDIELGITWIGE